MMHERALGINLDPQIEACLHIYLLNIGLN